MILCHRVARYSQVEISTGYSLEISRDNSTLIFKKIPDNAKFWRHLANFSVKVL